MNTSRDMPPPTSRANTAHKAAARPLRRARGAALVLLLALCARLLVLWSLAAKYPSTPFYSRGIEMGLLARSLVNGQGLSSPFGGQTGPTALIAPGYPILIAGVFRLFGTYSFASEIVIISLQIAASLVTVWLIMHLARKLFDRRVALIAGLIWSCSPPLLWIPTIFWDTSIAIAMLTGLLAFVLHIRSEPTREAWLLLGVYCAVAALINPALLPSMVAIIVWLAWQTRWNSHTHILLAALAFAIVFSPWPLRNARVFHAFVPLRTTVGFELWMGNHPSASGYLEDTLFPTFNPTELDDYKRFGEIAYTARKSELARQFIAEHPATFVTLTARRITRYWLGTGNRGGSLFFPMHAIFISAFGLGGLWLLLKRHRHSVALLFALPLLLFPLPYYITHAEFRYRLAIDTLLTILSAYILVHLHRRFSPGHDLSPAQASETQTIEAANA